MRRRIALALAAALAVLGASAGAVDGDARVVPAACRVPAALTTIAPFLAHVAAGIERGGRLTIVAVGSSSTRGFGASTPQSSYPSRLAEALRERLPDVVIRVVNRGRNGDEIAQMLPRFEREVVALHPDLVIWQLGTNAVLRHPEVSGERTLIRRGLEILKRSGGDVVLMDLQYAPLVLARRSHQAMERLIADAARHAGIGLFHRFAIMRRWHAAAPDAPATIGPDGLHMNDLGYGCLASELADALAANWRSHRDAVPPGEATSGTGGWRHSAAVTAF